MIDTTSQTEGGADGSLSELGLGVSGRTVEQLLEDARARLERLTPESAQSASRAGALLIDIRSELQRERDGVIPGARFIARNVLEWRCDPASPWRDPVVAHSRRRLILVCNEGYQSSLAAATIHQLGLVNATDVIGGFQAWRAAGLPVRAATPREHRSARRVRVAGATIDHHVELMSEGLTTDE